MQKKALIAVILLAGGQCLAQEPETNHPYLTDEFVIDFGMYFPSREIGIKVKGSVPGETRSIDFDEDFGVKKQDDLFAMNLMWRFGEKWHLGAQYFETDGQRENTLDEDVEWGDLVFGAGSGVTVGMDFSVIRTIVGRKFESEDHHEFGIAFGIHWLEIGANIQGDAIINGMPAGFRRESVSASAPLPNVGIWYTRSLSEKWALRTRLDWLSADIDEYDGRLLNASVGLNYRLFENFGLGVSYNVFELDLGVDKSNWRGEATMSFDGAFVYVSAFW